MHLTCTLPVQNALKRFPRTEMASLDRDHTLSMLRVILSTALSVDDIEENPSDEFLQKLV